MSDTLRSIYFGARLAPLPPKMHALGGVRTLSLKSALCLRAPHVRSPIALGEKLPKRAASSRRRLLSLSLTAVRLRQLARLLTTPDYYTTHDYQTQPNYQTNPTNLRATDKVRHTLPSVGNNLQSPTHPHLLNQHTVPMAKSRSNFCGSRGW